MKKLTKKIVVASVVTMLVFGSCNLKHMPGHGNWENKNLKESVISHVSSTLTNGETVEFGSKYSCDEYMENGQARFSANVIYYVVSKNGTKKKCTAHVICNEDRDRIIEWKDIENVEIMDLLNQ